MAAISRGFVWLLGASALLASPAYPQSGAPLPAGFKGTANYQGTIAVATTAAGSPSRFGPRPSSRNDGGPVTVDVEYDGPSVVAKFHGGQWQGVLKGTRTGNSCAMSSYETGGGTFRCDAVNFTGALDLAGRTRSFHTELTTQAKEIVNLTPTLPNTAPVSVGATPATQGVPYLPIAKFFNGQMRCGNVDRTVQLSLIGAGKGKGQITLFPPSGGASFDVSLFQDGNHVIHARPISKISVSDYVARQSGAAAFAIELREKGNQLYGVPSDPKCSALALVARSMSVPLTAEEFNALAELALKDALLRRPTPHDCPRGQVWNEEQGDCGYR